MNHHLPVIELSPQARDTLRREARASLHAERGGILVGWRTSRGLEVHDVLRVHDETARFSGYRRRRARAQEALDAYLTDDEVDGLGYIGEWHTHPLPQPPSPTDMASLRVMSLRNSAPVALIVAALQHDKRNVTLYGHATREGNPMLRLRHGLPAAIVCDDRLAQEL